MIMRCNKKVTNSSPFHKPLYYMYNMYEEFNAVIEFVCIFLKPMHYVHATTK